MIKSNIIDPNSDRGAKALAAMPDLDAIVKWQEADPEKRCCFFVFSNFKEIEDEELNVGTTSASCLGRQQQLVLSLAEVICRESKLLETVKQAVVAAENPLLLEITKQVLVGKMSTEKAKELLNAFKGKEAGHE